MKWKIKSLHLWNKGIIFMIGIFLFLWIFFQVSLWYLFFYICILYVIEIILIFFGENTDTIKKISYPTAQRWAMIAIANIFGLLFFYFYGIKSGFRPMIGSFIFLGLLGINLFFYVFFFHPRTMKRFFHEKKRNLYMMLGGVGVVIFFSLLASFSPNSSVDTERKLPGKSEFIGVLSTGDVDIESPSEEVYEDKGSEEIIEKNKDEEIIEVEKITLSAPKLDRYLGIGDSGEDVKKIAEFLRDQKLLETATGNYDTTLASAINDFIYEHTSVRYTGPNVGPQKQWAFNNIINTYFKEYNFSVSQETSHEVTGEISTDSTVKIESIESLQEWVTARIEDGKIIVEVIEENSIEKKGWNISTAISDSAKGRGLSGVVIDAPKVNISSGSYEWYRDISFSAAAATAIYFTTDGTDPSCVPVRGVTNIIADEDTIEIKAISCYGSSSNVSGLISTHTYSLKK